MTPTQQLLYTLSAVLVARSGSWFQEITEAIAASDTLTDLEKSCASMSVLKIPSLPFLFETLLFKDFSELRLPASLVPTMDDTLRIKLIAIVQAKIIADVAALSTEVQAAAPLLAMTPAELFAALVDGDPARIEQIAG